MSGAFVPSLEERRRLVAQSLDVGNPSRLGHSLPEQADPTRECPIEVSVDDIVPYGHNPRRVSNPRFDDIKESIRTGGLRTPLTVTRAPGERQFVVESGGNTRLRALKALWSETRDPRFGRLTVLFRPWRGHSQVLGAHLVENEQRGEMSFWDKACGIAALKSQIETERGVTLTLRTLEDALHGIGLSVNTATLGLYLFATERLRTLGEAFPDLSGLDVKTLQPRLNAIRRAVMARVGCDEDEVWRRAFEPAFAEVVVAGAGAVKTQGPASGPRVPTVIEACEALVKSVYGFDPSGRVPASLPRARVDEPRMLPDKQPSDALPADFAELLGAFARHTGVGFGDGVRVGDSDFSERGEWNAWALIDGSSLERLGDRRHRWAWQCLAAMRRRMERVEPQPSTADSVARPTDGGIVHDVALDVAYDVERIAWMHSTDPAAAAFRSLMQAMADGMGTDIGFDTKPKPRPESPTDASCPVTVIATHPSQEAP